MLFFLFLHVIAGQPFISYGNVIMVFELVVLVIREQIEITVSLGSFKPSGFLLSIASHYQKASLNIGVTRRG